MVCDVSTSAPHSASAASQAGSNVCIAPTMIGTPVSSETSAISFASSAVIAKGFSQRIALTPARHAAMTCSAWNCDGLQMTITSTLGSPKTSSARVVCAAPALRATLSAVAA